MSSATGRSFVFISCLGLILQEGTPLKDKMFAAVATEDGSFILAGYTEGDWGGSNAGGSDLAVVKLAPNGTVSWRWQVSVFLQFKSFIREEPQVTAA